MIVHIHFPVWSLPEVDVVIPRNSGSRQLKAVSRFFLGGHGEQGSFVAFARTRQHDGACLTQEWPAFSEAYLRSASRRRRRQC